MKVLIIGGVAGGASAAARLRRLREDAEIILLERGAYVSYANCGLPYYIGGEITQKSALTLQTPESLRQRLGIDVRVRHEALRIHPGRREVEIRDLEEGRVYTEGYDYLILSPGAAPLRPPLPGVDDERVFTLRTIPDTYAIDAFIRSSKPRHALVVGAGAIGLEMAENLRRRGLAVTIAELADHVFAPFDADMAAELQDTLRCNGVELLLGQGITALRPEGGRLHAELTDGGLDTDMVLLGVGVRPESTLAREAGLTLDERGAVVVDEHMRSSDDYIYAVGDVVQHQRLPGGPAGPVPLAGPANKQGRIAADNIAGTPRRYKGTQGTAILKLFDVTAGATGMNESAARAAGLSYDKVYLTPAAHAGYYPGAETLYMKVLFEQGTGRILGAQVLGREGADKRLDVLAVALRHGLTADDLSELELAYAPPYSSAKDPVNMAGFMIQNLLEGRVKQYHWHEVPRLVAEGAALLDVRSAAEHMNGSIEGSVNIPVDELRGRLGELDKTRPLYIYCQSGQRSYLASRILAAAGFDVRHLAGGWRLYATAALGLPSHICCVNCR